MSIEFKKELSLVFIFSTDFQEVLLQSVKNKLDGFLYPTNDLVQVCKFINEDTGLKVDPSGLNTVISLPQIDKLYKISVMIAADHISKADPSKSIQIIKSEGILPDNCNPQCKWLLPLILDPCMFRSQFNQILMM